jgi:serine/threonine protein kinase
MPKRRSTRSRAERPAGATRRPADDGVGASESPKGSRRPSQEPADDARRILGRYRLDEEIAVGGMAEVWRAEDETLSRPVAVKLLHQHLLPDAASRTRFEAEARLAASLSHPGIVTVYDVSVSEEEAAIVLEYVPGEGLNEVLARRGPLPDDEALELAAQIADALDHAHRRDVIHRDVKPDNILLAPNGQARLVDFGIARVAGDTAQRLTLAGTTLGTLRYMAPEQLAGEPGDARTDVFGLGATLYQMLSGRAPFDADAPAALIRQQRARPPAIPAVAPAIMNLIWDALDADPASRPSSAAEVASRLRGIQHGRTSFERSEEGTRVVAGSPLGALSSGAGERARPGVFRQASPMSGTSGAGSGPSKSVGAAPGRFESGGAGSRRFESAGVGSARSESAGLRADRSGWTGLRSGQSGSTGARAPGPGWAIEALAGLGSAWDGIKRQPIGGLALLLIVLLIVGAVIASARGGSGRGPGGPSRTFPASEDARVAIVGSVAEGAGADNTLPVGQYDNFLYRSLIRFQPDWKGMGRIVRIELRLQTTGSVKVVRGSSPSTIVRRNVSGAWTEGSASGLTSQNSVTWASKPQTTPQGQVRFDGPADANQTVSVDITELYRPFAPRNLGGQAAENLGITLQSASDDGQTANRGDTNEFWSSEGGDRGPKLVVTYEAG